MNIKTKTFGGTSKVGGWTFVITMLLLYVGRFVGSFILANAPLNINNAWAQGFIIALVQAALLVLANVLAMKGSLVDILIAALLIFAGGILGGYLAAYLNFTGLYATVVMLIIQTLLLSLTGYLRGGKVVKV